MLTAFFEGWNLSRQENVRLQLLQIRDDRKAWEEETEKILREIKRVLKPNGYLFFRINSTNSSEYKSLVLRQAEEIENNLFYTNEMEKRFFSAKDLDDFFVGWKWLCKREENMTRWCSDKIVWKCAVQSIKD